MSPAIMLQNHPLSNLQQELLRLYASNIAEADLLHIKTCLAVYFAQKSYKRC